MTTTTTTFSLLQLPTKALKMILTQDIDVMISFSFCSNRSKSIIQNLQIDYLHIECGFSRQNVLYVMFEDTIMWASEYSTVSNDMIEESVIIGQKLKHKLKAYTDHVYSVLNQPSFYVDVHCNEDVLRTYELHITSLRDVKIRRTSLSGSGSESSYLLNSLKFWRRFILPVQQIDLCQKLFETTVQSHRLLLQNFDYLGTNLGSNGKLNSILAMNSAFISITNYRREFTRNDVNIYLKHWINGLNPSLEYIEIESLVPGEKSITSFFDEVFNGINEETINKEYRKQTKYRKTHIIDSEQDLITRGFKIIRHDGTTADIWFHIRDHTGIGQLDTTCLLAIFRHSHVQPIIHFPNGSIAEHSFVIMTTTTTFSLLQLPKKALKIVLTQDIDVMIWFSFCSNRSKSIVQNLQIDYLHIKCHFSRQHALCLMFEDTPLWSSEYYSTSDHIMEERRNGQKCDCNLEAYIDHVYSVLNQSPFDVEIYNTEEVHKTYKLFVNMLEDVQIRRTTISANESPSLLNDEMFCRRFILPVQQIDLNQKLFETSVQSHRLLIQNVDYLGISLRYDEKLNSLLAMNSVFTSIANYRREFTRNDLNIYLKHWINGSNPSLEYIEIESLVPGEISMTSFFDEVFNGIK